MKIHVRKGTGNGFDHRPLCACNNRHYDQLPGYVVTPAQFRMTPDADRCRHCQDNYLEMRNAQRKVKGLPPVKTAFEGQDHI